MSRFLCHMNGKVHLYLIILTNPTYGGGILYTLYFILQGSIICYHLISIQNLSYFGSWILNEVNKSCPNFICFTSVSGLSVLDYLIGHHGYQVRTSMYLYNYCTDTMFENEIQKLNKK